MPPKGYPTSNLRNLVIHYSSCRELVHKSLTTICLLGVITTSAFHLHRRSKPAKTPLSLNCQLRTRSILIAEGRLSKLPASTCLKQVLKTK